MSAVTACPCVRVFAVPKDPSARCPSGFRNVYSSHSKENPWRAKVKLGGVLEEVDRAFYPHQAAAAVANWYRDVFGANWLEEARHRKRPKKWHVMRDRSSPIACWICWRADRDGDKWVLYVREGRKWVCVREERRKSGKCSVPRPTCAKPGAKPRGRVKTFASKEDAAAHVVPWMVARWGLWRALVARHG